MDNMITHLGWSSSIKGDNNPSRIKAFYCDGVPCLKVLMDHW